MYFERNYRLLTYGQQMNGIEAKPVQDDEWESIPKVFDYMLDVMRKANGVGLAAPQIGLFKQVFIVERYDKSVIGLINPEITRLYGREVEDVEGCLSLPPPGNECLVPRLETIDVIASLTSTPHIRKKFTFRASAARIVQHEIDHLSGTFFIDRVSERKKKEVLEKFYHWKSQRRAQIRRMEENRNGDSRLVTAYGSQSRLS